jgi:hypothetical protein
MGIYVGYAILNDMGGFITRPDGSATFDWLSQAEDYVRTLVAKGELHASDVTIVGLMDLEGE